MFQFPLFQNFLLDSIQIFLSLDLKSFKNSSNLKFHDIKSTDPTNYKRTSLSRRVDESPPTYSSRRRIPGRKREKLHWELESHSNCKEE